MSNAHARKDRLVTVTLKDGTQCQGRLFMSVSASNAQSGASSQPKQFIYLQVGESRKVVRFNVADVANVSPVGTAPNTAPQTARAV